MIRNLPLILATAFLLQTALPAQGLGDQTDEELRELILGINEGLLAAGHNIAVEQIEFFTIGAGRPPVRIHQAPFRWVAGDPRRAAQGSDITYIIDDANNAGPTSLGFFPSQELRSAAVSWDADSCMGTVDLAERSSLQGVDVTFFDSPLVSAFGACAGGGVPPGNPFAADIVYAGWYPAQCFGFGTLAVTITFIFTDTNGAPTDVNGDNRLDTALHEVYYNDAWGNPNLPPGDGRVNFPWNIGGLQLPNIDVQTVTLHESGHALELGHFGPPPAAAMNPSYTGPALVLSPIDHAGACTVWGSWPNP